MTNTDPFAIDPEELIRESARLRRLARRLVDDDQLVEDAVQHAYLKSLERDYRDPTHRSRWLWTTVRNAIFESYRSATHREHRERTVARHEATPSVEDTAVHLEAMDLVLQSLRSLREPYQSTLVRLFVHDLSPSEIARQDGVDVNVVHKRRQRGLEQMRADLDRRGGGREGWHALVVPFAMPPRAGFVQMLRSVSAMPLVWAALVAALLLCAGLVGWLRFSKTELVAASPSSSTQPTEGARAANSRSIASSRTAILPQELVEVRVVRAGTSEPVPGAAIRWWPLPDDAGIEREIEEWFGLGLLEELTQEGSVPHVSDERGAALLPAASNGFLAIATQGDLWGRAVVTSRRDGPVQIEVRPDADLEVLVLGDDGGPVEGAMASLRALGYTGVTFLARPTDRSGRAVLKHAGFIKNSTDDPAAAAASLTVGIVGEPHSWSSYLDAETLSTRDHVAHLTFPIAYADILIVDSVSGAPLSQRMIRSICLDWDNGIDEFEWGRYLADQGRTTVAVRIGKHLGWDDKVLRLLDADAVPAPTFAEERIGVTFAAIPPREPSTCLTVTGRLIGPDRRPVAQRRIALRTQGDGVVRAQTQTEHDGSFALPCDCGWDFDKPYDLDVVDAEGQRFVRCRESMNIRTVGDLLDLGELPCIGLATLLSGRISTPDGRAVADVRVKLASEDLSQFNSLGYTGPTYRETRTGSDGSFEFALVSLPEDSTREVTLIASHSAYATVIRLARAGDQGIEIELAATRTLAGRVLLDPSIPASNVWVEASAFEWELGTRMSHLGMAGAMPTAAFSSSRLDASGRFQLTGIGHGEHHLRVLYYGAESFSSYGTQLFATKFSLDDVEQVERMASIDLANEFHFTRVQMVEIVDWLEQPVPWETVYVGNGDHLASHRSDSLGVAAYLVQQGAHAYVDSDSYFYQAVDSKSTTTAVVLERRPQIAFEFADGPPKLDEGFELTLFVTPLSSRKAFYPTETSTGAWCFPAPDRDSCVVHYVLHHEHHKEPCGETIVTLEPGRDSTYLLERLDPSILFAATQSLGARMK